MCLHCTGYRSLKALFQIQSDKNLRRRVCSMQNSILQNLTDMFLHCMTCKKLKLSIRNQFDICLRHKANIVYLLFYQSLSDRSQSCRDHMTQTQ